MAAAPETSLLIYMLDILVLEGAEEAGHQAIPVRREVIIEGTVRGGDKISHIFVFWLGLAYINNRGCHLFFFY
jgi:hypothetical protein